MRYIYICMIYWNLIDLILWWHLIHFGLSILRCLSEPLFIFALYFLEWNLCYFTQKSLVGGGGIAIIESAPGPDLEIWDGAGNEMTCTWPVHDLYMTWKYLVWTRAWQQAPGSRRPWEFRPCVEIQLNLIESDLELSLLTLILANLVRF